MLKIPFMSALLCTFVTLGSAWAQTSPVSSNEQHAVALLERHQALAGQLATNAYARPIYLESIETSSMVTGNAYAVLNAPLPAVVTLFKNPNRWCEVMILHINTKFCKADADTAPAQLSVNVGKKTEQDLPDTFALQFAYRVAASTADYLSVQLDAEKGPLGTKNYRIELQAVPLPEGKTFIQLRYSYGFGMGSKLAMLSYMATLGSGKIGFTQANGSYVTGMRGTVERNTMRYYLAIESYLASLKAPAPQQLNVRLEHWFKATEQYSKQLHEVDLDSYLTMKKNEYQRQKTAS